MVMPVTPHGYAKFGYAGYAKHGYSICLCPIWLRHNSVSTESTTSYASCLMVRQRALNRQHVTIALARG